MSFAEAKREIDEAVIEIADKHKLMPTQTLMILGDLLHQFLDELTRTREREVLQQLRRVE